MQGVWNVSTIWRESDNLYMCDVKLLILIHGIQRKTNKMWVLTLDIYIIYMFLTQGHIYLYIWYLSEQNKYANK